MGRIIFAASGKGGTGKTSISAGVSSCLSILGRRTVLVDADTGLRNADIVMGLSDRAVMHFGDVLSGRVELSEALVFREDLPMLSVLAAPVADVNVDFDAMGHMLRQLAEEFDFVWVDGPAGISGWVRAIAGFSDTVIVAATPDVVSARDASRVSEIIDSLGKTQAYLVVNRVRPRLISTSGALYVDDIMDITGLPLLGLIPEDERVIAAANKGEPLVGLAQDGAALAYRNIALRLLGERVPLGIMRIVDKSGREFLSRLKKGAAEQ